MSSTRQEMTVMVNSMDKSYTEQGTNCDEAFSFMDTHNLNGRCKFFPFFSSLFLGFFFLFWKVKERCKWFLKYSSLLSHGKSMGPRVSHCAAHYSVYSNEEDSQTSRIDFFKNNKDNWAFFCPSFSLHKSSDITETVVLPFSNLDYIENLTSLTLSQVLQMLPLLPFFFW